MDHTIFMYTENHDVAEDHLFFNKELICVIQSVVSSRLNNPIIILQTKLSVNTKCLFIVKQFT